MESIGIGPKASALIQSPDLSTSPAIPSKNLNASEEPVYRRDRQNKPQLHTCGKGLWCYS